MRSRAVRRSQPQSAEIRSRRTRRVLGLPARGDAMPALIQAIGVWYFVALGAVFLAAAAKHASAPRSPEEDQARMPLDALHWFVALMGWSVLVLHGVFVGLSRGAPVWLLGGLPVAAMLVGALLGAILGADPRARAPVLRIAGKWLGVAALALAAWAAAPSVAALLPRG